MEYSFETSKNLNLIAGTSKIDNILLWPHSDDDMVKVQGQLLKLFGEPIYITPNLENAYIYVIVASDNTGKQFILSVYCGPSGPAIGGDKKIEGIQNVVERLKQYIQQAEPVDFEYVGYYLDTGSKITYEIKNGIISYSSVQIKGEELEKAHKLVYGHA